MIEDELRQLKVLADAAGLRELVLDRARRARGQQRRTRCVYGISLVSLALMILTYVFGTKAELRRPTVNDPELRPRIYDYSVR